MSNFYNKQSVRAYLLTVSNTELYASGWRTAADIQAFTGVTPLEMRKVCQQFTQTFISSGRGYKLVSKATGAELDNSLRILMSRANKINKRARSLQRFMLERNAAGLRVIDRALRELS